MTGPSRRPLPGAGHTAFGGYGPFVAVLALIAAMALLAPTIAPERVVITQPGPEPARNSLSSTTTDSWRPPAPGGVAEGRPPGGDRPGTAGGSAP